MTQDINNIIEKVFKSKEYKKFHENYPDYYLAHCFVQLDKNNNESKPWQIGFYSTEKDNIISFTIDSKVKKGEFEEAFKDGGIIERLKHDKVINLNKAIEIISEIRNENYKAEVINSYIIILQSIQGKATYNITAITLSFSMLIIKIDALTGEVISHDKRNILDLRKGE